MNSIKVLVLLVACMLLTGCADEVTFTQASQMTEVGFLHGLWHGMTCAFAFFGSLFYDDIAVYAIYNSGAWYDFGFLMGAGAFAGSCTCSSS